MVEVITTRMIDGSCKRVDTWDDTLKYVAPYGFDIFFVHVK